LELTHGIWHPVMLHTLNHKYFLFHKLNFISKQGLFTNKDVKIVLTEQKIILIQFTVKFETAFRQLETLVHGTS
jgi:hypothetical protein